MISKREEPIPEDKRESCANTELGPEVKNNCTIFLGHRGRCPLPLEISAL